MHSVCTFTPPTCSVGSGCKGPRVDVENYLSLRSRVFNRISSHMCDSWYCQYLLREGIINPYECDPLDGPDEVVCFPTHNGELVQTV